MSLATPTTQEIGDNIVAQIEASIAQTVPIMPRAFSRVIAKTLAGVFILLFKYAGFIFLQLFVRHATMAEVTVAGKKIRPLVEWGRTFGVPDQEPAGRAELTANVTVTNQTGSLPARSQLVRSDTGVIYETAFAVALNAATVPVTLRAVSDPDGNGGAGAIGNLLAGDVVEFANPLPNVARAVTVTGQVTAGVDAETVESYRARILQKTQKPPQGGAYADYQQWAEEVAGITHAYPYSGGRPGEPGAKPGEVFVYCEASEASSGSADGIPTSGQLTAVFNAIQLNQGGLATRRPVGAAVNVRAITRTEFGVTVTGLALPDDADTTELEASIDVAVDEYFRSREPFLVGLSILPRTDRITRAAISGIIDQVANAAGAVVTTVSLDGDIPAHTLERGEKAKLAAGGVTFA